MHIFFHHALNAKNNRLNTFADKNIRGHHKPQKWKVNERHGKLQVLKHLPLPEYQCSFIVHNVHEDLMTLFIGQQF